jgi:chloramphenicol O-acetyltransferase type A
MAGRVKEIDVQNWRRREHFAFFREFAYPHWGVTTDVDIAPLLLVLRQRSVSFTVGLVYALLRSVNAVPEFRQRIRGATVVEHERVDAGVTVLGPEDVFRFATVRYIDDFREFSREAASQIEVARSAAPFERNTERDDLIYLSAIPWFSFSALLHPLPLLQDDAVPRFAWGRFHVQCGAVVLPLNVQAHHGLIDAIHIARFLSVLEQANYTSRS